MTTDFRFDPFTNTLLPLNIAFEEHYIPHNSPYYVRLYEVPAKENPSSIRIRIASRLTADIDAGTTMLPLEDGNWYTVGEDILVDSEQMQVTGLNGDSVYVTRGYNGSTAVNHTAWTYVIKAPMQEVAASPQPGQYRPDYTTKANSDDDWNTGTLQFHSSESGKRMLATYRGTGTLIDSRIAKYGCQLFKSDGMFVVPSGVKEVWVSAVGGGCGVNTRYVSDVRYGESGKWIWRQKISVPEFARIWVTIGRGGATTNWLDVGGDTLFGSYLTLEGGKNNVSTNSSNQTPFSIYDVTSFGIGRGNGGTNQRIYPNPTIDGQPGMLIVEWGLEQVD